MKQNLLTYITISAILALAMRTGAQEKVFDLRGSIRPVTFLRIEGTGPADTPVPASQPVDPRDEQPPVAWTPPPVDGQRPLPIDLVSALRLVDSNSLDVAIAAQQVRKSYAQYEQLKYSWLPTISMGPDMYRHAGNLEDSATGKVFTQNTNFFNVGTGLNVFTSPSDAIFYALAQKQVVASRRFDRVAATNDTTLAVAQAYFRVQQARGEMAGAEDTVKQAEHLVQTAQKLAPALAPPVEVFRARAELARRRQSHATALEQWRLASADLIRVLRLDPSTRIEPAEPPHLQVSLISLQQPIDELIPIGLRNRPELASQRALVEAALLRLKAERIRPLVPSLVLSGGPGPGLTNSNFSEFGGGNTSAHNYASRADVNVQAIWQLEGLGFVTRAKIKERTSDRQLALLQLFHVQDLVAAEVAQAYAQARSAESRMRDAEAGLKDAIESLAKNFQGLTQTRRAGDLNLLLIRPQEVVAAVQALANAYTDYYGSVADFNRSQFLLFRALGYPAPLTTGSIGAPCPPVINSPPR
jgi:outer membrane protein TolC